MEGMSFTMEGGKSSPWEAPKGSRFTPWVDMTVIVILAMDIYGPKTELPGVVPDGSNTIEKWFGKKKDRIIKHTFDGYRVHNPNPYSHSKENIPYYIVPQQRDTSLLRSKVLNTNWNNFKKEDSLKKSNTAKMLNTKYNL